MPKISALPAMVAGDLTTADLLPVVDSTGPTTRKTTIDIFRVDFLAGVGMTATPLNGVTSITTTLGVGVGAAASTSRAVNVTGTTVLTAGTSQYGAYIGPTMTSAATTAGYGIYIVPTTAAAAFTQTNTYGIYIDTATIGAASAITNQYGIYINTPTGAATINRALHIAGGGVQIAGGGLAFSAVAAGTNNVAIGRTAAPSTGLIVEGAIVTASGNAAYGAFFDVTMDATATSSGTATFTKLVTAAAAFTMVSGYGLYVDTPSKGAGSAITTAYGIMVKAQTQGGTTNVGIQVEAASGGSGAGDTSIRVNPGVMGVSVTGTSVGTQTSKWAFRSTVTADTGVSAAWYDFSAESTADGTMTSLYGFYSATTTTAAVFTLTNRYGMYIANVAKGAGSTITNDYGLYIVGPTQGGTINYGIYVGGGTPAIYVAAGGQTFLSADGNNVGIGTSKSASHALRVAPGASNFTSGAASQYAIAAEPLYGATATTAGYGIYVGASTGAVAFTQTNHYGIYVDAVAKGAGSTITNRYGLYIVNPTDGGTLNRALYISGAAAVVESQGRYMAMSGTAVPATAGAVAAGAPITLYSGAVTVEATSDVPTHTRPKGSLCINTGGTTTNNRMYTNTDGAGTWTAFTTAA